MDPGSVFRLRTENAPPGPGDNPPRVRLDRHGTAVTLSYTALSTFEQCGYRFYVQRVLGLPDLPTPVAAGDADERSVGRPAPPRPGLSGVQRGTLIHQLLAGMDLRNPSLRDPMPAEVRALLAGLVGSTTFVRLSGLRDVRREQRFAYPVGETLITGVFDLIAQDEPGHLLVLDYKSDRLTGTDPAAIVAERYIAQRTIYALAALKLGAPAVEVVHLFLEAPDELVSAEFAAAETPALEAELAARVAKVSGAGSGGFHVTETPGPPGLRWLPGSGRALLLPARAHNA